MCIGVGVTEQSQAISQDHHAFLVYGVGDSASLTLRKGSRSRVCARELATDARLLQSVCCEAAIPSLRAEHDDGFTLIAARDTDRILSALRTLVHHQCSGGGLNRFARQHRPSRAWAIHFESRALESVVHCGRLKSRRQRRCTARRRENQRRSAGRFSKYANFHGCTCH